MSHLTHGWQRAPTCILRGGPPLHWDEVFPCLGGKGEVCRGQLTALPRHRKGLQIPHLIGPCLGANKEPEMALLLFVIMEIMPPVWEPSVPTRRLSEVRIRSAHRWQAECRPHACVLTGPLRVFSTCPFPQHGPCSNTPAGSVIPTLHAVFGRCHHLEETKASLLLGTAILTVQSCKE